MKKKTNKKKQNKKKLTQLDYKKLYWFMMDVFRITSEELYDKLFLTKTDKELDRFRKLILIEVMRDKYDNKNEKVCSKA